MESKAKSTIMIRRNFTITKQVSCNRSQKYKILRTEYVLSGFFIGAQQYAVLIDPNTGNRHTDPIPVIDMFCLTGEEFDALICKEPVEIVLP